MDGGRVESSGINSPAMQSMTNSSVVVQHLPQLREEPSDTPSSLVSACKQALQMPEERRSSSTCSHGTCTQDAPDPMSVIVHRMLAGQGFALFQVFRSYTQCPVASFDLEEHTAGAVAAFEQRCYPQPA